MPAAMCGCVAIKPTYGLVPLLGSGMSPTSMDYICPMAATVSGAARLLEVIAGPDWRDPSAITAPPRVGAYADAGGEEVRGLRIGLVEECLDDGLAQPAVRAGLDGAAEALADAGATVETVSVPRWNDAFPIWLGVWLRGITARVRSDDMGYPGVGYVEAERVHAAGLRRRGEAKLLPPLMKLTLITTAYVESKYFNTPFAKVYNQRLALKRELDEALERYDLLLTPTSPTTAVPLATEPVSEAQALSKVVSQVPYTAPLNLTGHPALAMPSGEDEEGLPTSVQLIGDAFDEQTVFRAAFALERSRAGQTSPTNKEDP